jgi:carbamoyl-phosphate synthase large subunit
MAGEKLKNLPPINLDVDYIAIKEAVFPFARFQGVDPVLSPEMKSTGEVMGIDTDFATAFAKAQLGAGMNLPQSGKLFVSVKDSDKVHIVPAVQKVIELGFSVCATGGTADYLAGQGIEVERVNKVAQGRPHIVDKIIDGEIALVFNTTEGWQSLKDSEDIRRSALMNKVSYFTTASASLAAAQAIEALDARKLEVRTLQDYHKR